MKKRTLLVLPILCLATACTKNGQDCYAYFMNNYPRVTLESAYGYQEMVDNTLYLRMDIKAGKPFNKPADPTRENYEFQGWFSDKDCQNEWNFASDTTDKSIYLYAKWGQTQVAGYQEPEYVVPETFITDANYRVMGILNQPIKINGSVDLTQGGINRLKEHANDISFAVNYERKQGVTLSVATYDASESSIHLQASTGEVFDIRVNDVTESLSVKSANSTFEDKAAKYETTGKDIENYHIALGGSSSMENWSSSTLDMSPIVTFNHGIGGTTVEQWTEKLFDRLIRPYSPKAVVYYVGVNNIINGDQENGTAVGVKLNALFTKTHDALPNAKVFYVLINKLPNYAHKQNDFDLANDAAIEFAKHHSYLTCINAGEGLLKEDGSPNAAYFLGDGLHMSKYGYVIWGQAVKDAIIEWLDSTKK